MDISEVPTHPCEHPTQSGGPSLVLSRVPFRERLEFEVQGPLIDLRSTRATERPLRRYRSRGRTRGPGVRTVRPETEGGDTRTEGTRKGVGDGDGGGWGRGGPVEDETEFRFAFREKERSKKPNYWW